MKRQAFTFRPSAENPNHQKAWALLMAQPPGTRNSFLVNAILTSELKATLESCVRTAIREELSGLEVCGKSADSKPGEPEIREDILDYLTNL